MICSSGAITGRLNLMTDTASAEKTLLKAHCVSKLKTKQRNDAEYCDTAPVTAQA
jgi:hypothetical protein